MPVKPFNVLAKPTGAICNLDCTYCFYLKKKELYPNVSRFHMPDEVLEAYTKNYINNQPTGNPEIDFAWQGGEPTLMGLDFFKRAIELQQQYARPGMHITNSLQTNCTLLNDEWAEFLAEHDFLVGVSIDGPAKLHDHYRVSKNGSPSFDRVVRGVEYLKKHKVEFNTLTVVNNINSPHPKKVYNLLKDLGSTFFQFIPIVEPVDGEMAEHSVLSKQYGTFLNGIFDEWIAQEDIGKIYVQHFDMMLGIIMGHPASICVHAETCGSNLAIEHNGDVYSCDHYVNPQNMIGNATDTAYQDMLNSDFQVKFGNDKRDELPQDCKACEYIRYCYGGCPKDRLSVPENPDPRMNYLCKGYKTFYSHTLPYFEKMAVCLRSRRPASDWKQWEAIQTGMQQRSSRPGRNDPCPCGSGRKFKKCHGA